MSAPRVELRVVSGGQTGVDRAALDAARARGLACGGWCPRGRRAEDGAIPGRYPLRETRSGLAAERTARNVLDADATLILARGAVLAGGTRLTAACARAAGRPLLVIDLDTGADPARVQAWLRETGARVVNVAGPREREQPGIGAAARTFLERALA